MEQKIVPTSPQSPEFQERKKKQQEKRTHTEKHPHLIFAVIVVTLLFGTVAGFFGFMIAANLPSDLPVVGDVSLVSIVEQQKQNVLFSTRTHTQSVVQSAPYVIEQVASVYTTTPTLNEPGAFVGNAATLTADGWMVMPTSTFLAEAVVITHEGAVSAIIESIPDPLTQLTFFRVAADNLPVTSFTEHESLRVGETVSVLEKSLSGYVVYQRSVAGPSITNNAIRSTTVLQEVTVLDTGNDVHQLGSIVFAPSGELVGLVVDGQRVIHASLIEGVLETLVSTGDIIRSAWDVDYINIQHLTKDERDTRQLPENGLYITAVDIPSADVVIDRSLTNDSFNANATPSASNELLPGDLITAINSAPITIEDDLSSTIHARPVGILLYFTVIRDSEEIVIPLEL